MPTRTFLQALTDRLRRQLEREASALPELAQHPGFVFDNDSGAIDDGRYGDPLRDERPDFIKADTAGWQPFISFKR